MKEQELDKFVNQYVKVTDFENDEFIGRLHKILDSKTYERGFEVFHAIKNGYHLERIGKNAIDFRKSYIKKIEIIKGENR